MTTKFFFFFFFFFLFFVVRCRELFPPTKATTMQTTKGSEHGLGGGTSMSNIKIYYHDYVQI